MFIAILQTNPSVLLETAVVESVRERLEGGPARWLAPGQAVEFPVADPPRRMANLRAGLLGDGIDFALLPAMNRKKRLLIADMDSTMIGQECIDELAAAVGVGPRVAEITARAMRGALGFEGALTERVALLEGTPVETIDEVLAKRIRLVSGGPQLVATMRANGAYTVMVSGGFTAFAEPIGARIGFDEVRANRLLVESGKLTGRVARPILGRAAKTETLEEITARLGLGPDDALAVGDGANDAGMVSRAGLGVALHAKPALKEVADVVLDHADLTGLLYLQGYAREDFVAP